MRVHTGIYKFVEEYEHRAREYASYLKQFIYLFIQH